MKRCMSTCADQAVHGVLGIMLEKLHQQMCMIAHELC